MQFSIKSALSLLTIFSASALADHGHGYLQNISLYVESNNTEINGNGLVSKHSGAGVDNIYLATEAEQLIYDNSKNLVYRDYAGQYKEYLDGDSDGFIKLTVSDDLFATFLFGDSIDGGKEYMSWGSAQTGFYACKNVNEAYNYSASQYELMYYPYEDKIDNDSCVAVKVYREFNN
ncbi:unnamed protein product [Ambrosiozyma monospora]|uniref:Unnamed protein product n=1 Tax=Ambrosiozyma monospora TaxID=43982 RepID=A0ACB5SW70_AMBMO|nr:unnamed protein product [Ambrosiozyma monospora]